MNEGVLLHVVTSHSFGLQGIRDAMTQRMSFVHVSCVLMSDVERVSMQWCSVVIRMQVAV